MHHPTGRITHTTAFVTPVVEHWLEREIAQWVHPLKDRSDDPSRHEQTLLPRNYISLLISTGMQITFGTLMNNWAIDFNLYFTRYTTAVFLFLTSVDYNMSFFLYISYFDVKGDSCMWKDIYMIPFFLNIIAIF